MTRDAGRGELLVLVGFLAVTGGVVWALEPGASSLRWYALAGVGLLLVIAWEYLLRPLLDRRHRRRRGDDGGSC